MGNAFLKRLEDKPLHLAACRTSPTGCWERGRRRSLVRPSLIASRPDERLRRYVGAPSRAKPDRLLGRPYAARGPLDGGPLDNKIVGPALVAGPSLQLRPAGEQQPYNTPGVQSFSFSFSYSFSLPTGRFRQRERESPTDRAWGRGIAVPSPATPDTVAAARGRAAWPGAFFRRVAGRPRPAPGDRHA